MENFVDKSETETALENAAQATAETSVDALSATGADDSDQSMGSLMEVYEESLKQFEEGEVVIGTIISVDRDHVLVDVGYKSEGRIPITEFTEIPSVGETVSVVFVSKEGRGGQVVVSKKKADLKIRTENLRESYEKQEPVEGTFSKVIKGGFEIDLMYDLSGFCPLSKADLYRVENPEDYIGIKDYFIIDKLHTGMRMKSVLSRRAYLEKAISERKEKFSPSSEEDPPIRLSNSSSFSRLIRYGLPAKAEKH